MTTITLEIPTVKQSNILEYKEIFSILAKEYSLQKLREMKEKNFYLNMLDGVFSEKEDFKELSKKNGKLDFSELLK